MALTAAFPRQYHCPPRIPCPPTSRDVPALTAGASGRCGPAVPSRCVRFKFKLAVPRPCWGPGRQGGLNAGRPGVCCDPPAQGKDGGGGPVSACAARPWGTQMGERRGHPEPRVRLAPRPGVPALPRERRTPRSVPGPWDGGLDSRRCGESTPAPPRRPGPAPHAGGGPLPAHQG